MCINIFSSPLFIILVSSDFCQEATWLINSCFTSFSVILEYASSSMPIKHTPQFFNFKLLGLSTSRKFKTRLSISGSSKSILSRNNCKSRSAGSVDPQLESNILEMLLKHFYQVPFHHSELKVHQLINHLH